MILRWINRLNKKYYFIYGAATIWIMCSFSLLIEHRGYRELQTYDSVKVSLHNRNQSFKMQDDINNECDKDKIESKTHSYDALHTDRRLRSSVMITWCQSNGTFTFRQYLSLRSILSVLQPDEITLFYAANKPSFDVSGYNDWLVRFVNEYPFFHISRDTNICINNNDVNEDVVFRKLVVKLGGIFVNIDAILGKKLHHLLDENEEALRIRNQDDSWAVFAVSKQFANAMFKRTSTGFSYFVNETAMSFIKEIDPCIQPNSTYGIRDVKYFYQMCIDTRKMHNSIDPSVIKMCDSPICRYFQQLHLGYEYTLCNDMQRNSQTIPNVVHYIHFGRLELSFMFYLSALSFLYIQHVDMVFIHTDNDPSGKWWTKLHIKASERLQIVYRSNPSTVFNQPIRVIQHAADIAKADIAVKYGGIIADPDVILVKKLKSDWFGKDVVVGLDIGKHGEFPDILNMGIILCKPQNKFAKLWIDSMRQFNDSDWLRNCGEVTYKLVENDPMIAQIEPRLQVICFMYKCYPSWLPKSLYHSLNTEIKTLHGFLQNWTSQVYSFHFTFPEPFVSEQYLRKQTGFLGEIGRHIYKSAGLTME